MTSDFLLAAIKNFLPRGLFLFLQPAYHFLVSFCAAAFYGFPSRRLWVIGVTGTKGKTTVVELVHEILKETGAKIASLSSARFRIGEKEELNMRKMTMPGRFFVQKFLHQALRAGCKYAVLEVTSEGIKQFRHRFIRFHAAALTNVHHEHIESHGGFERYLRAKLDLFWRLSSEGSAIINQDDPAADRFAAATPARLILYKRGGIGFEGKVLATRDVKIDEEGISFEINGRAFSSKLLGEFNFYNILGAAALGLSQHVALEKIALAIARVGSIPGRMEFIQKEPFTVVVDYAHTPDSLRNVYAFLRENPKSPPSPDGYGRAGEIPSRASPTGYSRNPKLICVLGAAGGGRDKWKRPEFGKIAAEFCKDIILTDEDPYDENPAAILSEIKFGITSNRLPATKIVLNRREAIREALKLASAGDTIIITGKGAEPWIMGAHGSKIPWDDREVVKEELKKL